LASNPTKINPQITIIAVVGSQTWTDKGRMYLELKRLRVIYPNLKVVVSGDCPRGADRIAKEWAADQKLVYKGIPADWLDFSEPCYKKQGQYGVYNALAGFNRNTKVAEAAQVCAAFIINNSNGTMDTVKKFIDRKKFVHEYHVKR
jgi:hypothetical protein